MTLPAAATAALLASAKKLEAEAAALRSIAKGNERTATFRPPFCKGGQITDEHIAHCPALHAPGAHL